MPNIAVDLKQTQKMLQIPVRQYGFTLIELMIALTLGLLITAAVIQVYFVSTRTSVIQTSGSSIVDTNVFGINPIEYRIKLAGLGLSNVASSVANQSAIIFNPSDNLKGVKLAGGDDIPLALMTTGEDDTVGSGSQWTGVSNTNNVSDQLTIQYRAYQDMFDCEGKPALGPRKVTMNGVSNLIDGQIIIERYFLREDSNGKLALACDAGRYINEVMDDYTEQGDVSKPSTVFSTKNEIASFGDAGVVVAKNIDDFQIQLGVGAVDDIQYYSPTEYVDSLNNDFPIKSVKLGFIIASDKALPGTEEGVSSFTLLGETATISDDVSKKIIREVFESNIMLRNARVI